MVLAVLVRNDGPTAHLAGATLRATSFPKVLHGVT